MESAGHSGDGGYNYEFVDTPLERVICVMCHLPSREAYLTECCGHVFCKSCLNKEETTACPMCSDKNFKTFHNKQINRQVRGLLVYCVNKGKGCKWKGEVNDVRNHLETSDGCQFEEVKCLNECEEMVQRRFLMRHLESECQHRDVECQYCLGKIKLSSANGTDCTHFEECPKLPLLCPNDCEVMEMRMILRDDMEAHRKECPLEIIQCEYHSVGCEVRMFRKMQREHYEENMAKHLRLTKDEVASTKAELALTKSELLPKINNLEVMLKILTSSSSIDLTSVCPDPSLLSSQAEWSIQLATMETAALMNEQTCPAFLRVPNVFDFESGSVDWSRYIFSHERGYRMEFSLYPYLADDNVEVSLELTKGPYDEDLQWPLRAKFQVTLLNQIIDDEHVSVTLSYDDNTPVYVTRRRLQDDEIFDHDFYGFDLISSRDLHKITPTCAYIKNNCMLLKVCKL